VWPWAPLLPGPPIAAPTGQRSAGWVPALTSRHPPMTLCSSERTRQARSSDGSAGTRGPAIPCIRTCEWNSFQPGKSKRFDARWPLGRQGARPMKGSVIRRDWPVLFPDCRHQNQRARSVPAKRPDTSGWPLSRTRRSVGHHRPRPTPRANADRFQAPPGWPLTWGAQAKAPDRSNWSLAGGVGPEMANLDQPGFGHRCRALRVCGTGRLGIRRTDRELLLFACCLVAISRNTTDPAFP